MAITTTGFQAPATKGKEIKILVSVF